MKNIVSLLIVLLLAIGTRAQSQDEATMKKVFEDYKSAILNDKADAALDAIDTKTKNYYAAILSQVKKADSTSIAAMSMVDKITVLGIRARANREEILSMQGYDAFLFAIKKGMVGKNSVSNNALGAITINKDFASAEMMSRGKSLPPSYHFYRETDGWKLNLTELFALGNASLKQMIDNSGKSENEYLLEILSLLTNKEQGYHLWKPVE